MVRSGKTGLRLRVTALAETVVRKGHPWVFAGSVREENRSGEAGELAVIYDRGDKFLAVGLYDPDSPIRVRILHVGKPKPIDAAWWKTRLEEALELRKGLFDSQTTGYRCINGENDGWPGLVVDRYDGTLVVKIYTAIWFSRLKEILELINGQISNERIVLRLSRNIQEKAGVLGFSDGQIMRGANLEGPVIFLENGLKFEADVLQGQKTGFFLDQRENRKQVESFAAGRKVLNVFSFSGGFSVYAARGGATEVASLDISEHALAAAQRNFALNELKCPHETIQANAFQWFQKKAEKKYDLIVLDPPSLAKRESEREEALQAYGKLMGGALERLNQGGILVAASCSAHVSVDEFFEMALETAKKSGRRFEELMRTGHAPDHPATYKEGMYLKAIYLRLD